VMILLGHLDYSPRAKIKILTEGVSNPHVRESEKVRVFT
jgi:hypothetical protein